MDKKNKDNKDKNRKTEQINLDEFFNSDENLQVRNDIENINKDYEDVDVEGGRDVFEGLNDGTKRSKIDIEEKVYVENSGEQIGDGLLYKNLDTVLHESMIPYSEHVILDRALPRVEDGLKPVQRRILYSMLELGVTPDKPFRKSARIVGDCLGKYHPHGDASVYDAMVRMAQPFNCNEVLVSGNGNFGSIDGDGAAAIRYTEARLSPLSMELLRDLDKNTVKWQLNFDDTTKEPEILPGRYPNLLVNGTSGIAVGLATNIPPHNLGETIDGVVAYIDNPKITLKEMMKIIKGPDFPTGAYILSNSELEEAYKTGKGKLYIRAKMKIEGATSDKKSIVITELPYGVNKALLLQKIAMLKEEGKYEALNYIQEVRDESDREGIRAVIKLKKDANVKKIIAILLKNTELQTTFGVNMVAIANGKPKQMGLMDIISYYAEYQREVIYRRSKYELEQAEERAHILRGLIIAIKNIDAVVKIIKTSQNSQEAKLRLKEKFKLSDRQAQAILDMRLARLTSLEVYKLEQELKQLEELISKLKVIVSSPKKQFEVVKQEILGIKKMYKRDRGTLFLKESEEDKIPDDDPSKEEEKEVVVVKTATDFIKKVPLKQYNLASKEIKETTTQNDINTIVLNSLSNSSLIAFTNLGNAHRIEVKNLVECRLRDKGASDYSLFKELNKDEHIVSIFDEKTLKNEGNFLFVTKMGMIKKTELKEYMLSKKVYQAMKLKEDDEILGVYIEPKNSYTFVFVTYKGMVLNAKSDDVPLQFRVSGGVKGINLADKDYVKMCMPCENEEGEIVCITTKGLAKRVIVASIDSSVRYRKGVKLYSNESISFAGLVKEEKKVVVFDKDKNIYFKDSDLVNIVPYADKGRPFVKGKKSIDVDCGYLV